MTEPRLRLIQVLSAATILLVVCLLVTGIMQFKAINSALGVLSNLSEQQIPALNILQAMTQKNADQQRFQVGLLFADSVEENTYVEKALSNAKNQYFDQVTLLKIHAAVPESNAAIERLLEAKEKYAVVCQEFSDLVKSGNKIEAQKFRIKILRPSFENTQQMECNLAAIIQKQAKDDSDRSAAKLKETKALVAILTLWPLVVMSLLAALTVGFLILIWSKIPKTF